MTIGLRSFQSSTSGMSGFGAGTDQDIAELSKALEAGYQTGAGKTGGSALRVESLEASLKVLTYTSSHIKFWKKIPKSPAYSTVEEYNQLINYGGSQNPFVQEGELPQATDTSYARRVQLVKFLGTTREVTHQASLVHPAHGDLIALENQSGILWLLEQVERNLFSGDSSLSFDGEAEQWDGLDSLIAPQNGQVGQTIQTISTQAGVIEFNPDVFIRQNATPPAAATSPNAPAAPVIIAAITPAGTSGDHNKGAPTGTSNVNYVATACNRFGESAPSPVQAAVEALTQANKDVGLSLPVSVDNAPSVGAFPTEYLRIYRSAATLAAGVPADLSAYSLIAQVPVASQAASGTTVFDDVNLTLPFTSTAYLGELTPSVVTFRQLMPMMKMDLAVLSPAYRWMILLYGTPILFAPKKWIRMINIGRLEVR